MTADLTCQRCEGTGDFLRTWPGCERRHPTPCQRCDGSGRRPPTLKEWDALVAERDRLRDERMSNMTVGGKRLTWQEAAEYHYERAQHEGRLAGVLADLDRCGHGRHQGDDCGSCGGPSHGNPHLQPVMGYNLSSIPIVMPADARERRTPEAWYARAGVCDACGHDDPHHGDCGRLMPDGSSCGCLPLPLPLTRARAALDREGAADV